VGQVGLGVNHHAAASIDQARVGITHAIFFVKNGITAIANLLHFHGMKSLGEMK
jgi:hypothetical protein